MERCIWADRARAKFIESHDCCWKVPVESRLITNRGLREWWKQAQSAGVDESMPDASSGNSNLLATTSRDFDCWVNQSGNQDG
jgi:hypothetical protein